MALPDRKGSTLEALTKRSSVLCMSTSGTYKHWGKGKVRGCNVSIIYTLDMIFIPIQSVIWPEVQRKKEEEARVL